MQKGSNRGQRLETTGQPPNPSRARKPSKNGTFAFSYRREVLAKNASGSDLKNLTIASRGDEQIPKWRVHTAFFLRCSYELFRCYDVAQRSIGTGNTGLILVGNTP
jgi:hypothetical protein